MSPPIIYPPYGRMILEWETYLGEPGKEPAPTDWSGQVVWAQWRDGVSNLLAQTLWPRWEPKTGWVGAAASGMHALTLADFELFPNLRSQMKRDEVLPGGVRIAQTKLFQLEDEADAKDPATGEVKVDRSLDASLRLYLSKVVDSPTLEAIVGGYLPGLGYKSGNVDLEVKRDMQRPRPYQIAFLLGNGDFTHNHAKSAVTPSMISGHCVEAMMGGVATWYALETGGLLAVHPALGEALARHTVDAGDRRVFGGVHYPSDNISSWLTGLLMSPQVCPDGRGGAWLWDSIQRHSRVYKALATHARTPGSPYAQPMALLAHLGALAEPTLADAASFIKGQPAQAERPAPGRTKLAAAKARTAAATSSQAGASGLPMAPVSQAAVNWVEPPNTETAIA